LTTATPTALPADSPDPPDPVHAAQEHEPGLLRYARHLTGRDAVAREVVQDTLTRLLEQPVDKRGELTGGRLKAWLYTVCRNRCFDPTPTRAPTPGPSGEKPTTACCGPSPCCLATSKRPCD